MTDARGPNSDVIGEPSNMTLHAAIGIARRELAIRAGHQAMAVRPDEAAKAYFVLAAHHPKVRP